MSIPPLLIFDTGPLSHFAEAGWLGILKAVTRDETAVIPDVVEDELKQGAGSNPWLTTVLEAEWIGRHPLTTGPELARFAHHAAFLVSGGRNRGDAAVLALAEASSGKAVLDDRVARRAAQRGGIPCTGTLGLLTAAIRSRLLTVELVSEVADDLLRSEYRYPFEPGGFAHWAADNGLVD